MNIYVSSVCFFFRMSKCSHFFTHVVKSISKSKFFCFLDFFSSLLLQLKVSFGFDFFGGVFFSVC
mgnify:CR=1 FL=1